MIKVEIKKGGVVTNATQYETQAECEAWYNENLSALGKIDRWVTESELLHEREDITLAVEEKTEESLGVNVKSYRFLADHTVTYTDVSAENLSAKEKVDALKYLAETDWYIIRKSETGVEVPAEVLTLRAAARLKA